MEALSVAIATGIDGVQQPDSALSSSNQSAVLDEEVHRKLQAAMNPEKLAQLYSLCLSDVRRRVGIMRTAASTGDDATYRKEAHAIKGGCGMVGATELQAIAATGETAGISANHVVSLDEFLQAADRLERMLFANLKRTESSVVESARSNA
jgi:HPt (histidine-containing phosphotransfer) domain-containing protein